jgi:fatty-acyl-CoA synthase
MGVPPAGGAAMSDGSGRASGPAPGEVSRGEAAKTWVRALDAIKIMEEQPAAVLPGLMTEIAAEYADRIALLDEAGSLTYRQLAARMNATARWALAEGLAAGDVVALLMPNRADYVALWLGLTLVGCPVALLNTNLAGDALLHCLTAARASRLIADASLLAPVLALRDRLPAGATLLLHGEAGQDTGLRRIDGEIAALSGEPLPAEQARPPAPRDPALLIYTSGTTGLPKAAFVTHARVMEWSHWFAGMTDAGPDDRMYDCLPMYHSVGGVVAVGAMLVRGGSVLIRRRFSASRFWDDVADGGCTLFQYIGELCRYLVASPPHPKERAHRLRLACGNGMRGDVWERFQARFAIPRVLEFYAATEGNVSLYNAEGRPGAIGRVPAFLAHRFPVALVRVNEETGDPLRGPDGLCIACAADEPGEAVGRIVADAATAARRFDGYTDAAASERKVLRDVFSQGDVWFRTGDLMRKDRTGFWYFLDRLGDTFRWKGENVSTTEVEKVVAACPGVAEAVVYGVAVPGHEGRAGMAAIVPGADFDIAKLYRHLADQLPEYAQPLFVRMVAELDVTGTFKPQKGRLAREGFAPQADGETVWMRDEARGGFVVYNAG